jgi:hypothetical protein
VKKFWLQIQKSFSTQFKGFHQKPYKLQQKFCSKFIIEMKSLVMRNYINEDMLNSNNNRINARNSLNANNEKRREYDNQRKELLRNLVLLLSHENKVSTGDELSFNCVNNRLKSPKEIMNLINTLKSTQINTFDDEDNEEKENEKEWKTPQIESYLPNNDEDSNSLIDWNSSELYYYNKEIISDSL